VGTTNPGRLEENAALLQEGLLPETQIEEIRARWKSIADSTWIGQI
jgi:hypothetical protein